MAEVNVKRVKSSEIEFKDRLVAINRVTKVTKGGRTFSFSAIVVIGNENGVVGYGLGKAKEVQAAIQKGVDDAKKNLIKVPVLKGTIPHEQTGKYSGARVFLKPAAPGTGVIAIAFSDTSSKSTSPQSLPSAFLLNSEVFHWTKCLTDNYGGLKNGRKETENQTS